MKDFLTSCLSRKFVSAHVGVLFIFVIAIISKNGGLDSGVAISAITAITALLSAYQAGNTISKKYQGDTDAKL